MKTCPSAPVKSAVCVLFRRVSWVRASRAGQPKDTGPPLDGFGVAEKEAPRSAAVSKADFSTAGPGVAPSLGDGGVAGVPGVPGAEPVADDDPAPDDGAVRPLAQPASVIAAVMATAA